MKKNWTSVAISWEDVLPLLIDEEITSDFLFSNNVS